MESVHVFGQPTVGQVGVGQVVEGQPHAANVLTGRMKIPSKTDKIKNFLATFFIKSLLICFFEGCYYVVCFLVNNLQYLV
jgi:hypothetical protein